MKQKLIYIAAGLGLGIVFGGLLVKKIPALAKLQVGSATSTTATAS